jgi:cytochrome c oxidase assembly factor CtaG
MVSAMTLNALVPILLMLVVLATDVWVYRDSGSRLTRGEPVTVTFGPFRLESPTVWFVACLVLWILAFPLYLVARGQS